MLESSQCLGKVILLDIIKDKKVFFNRETRHIIYWKLLNTYSHDPINKLLGTLQQVSLHTYV